MKTIYYNLADVPVLDQKSIQGVLPQIAWSSGEADGEMYSIEASLSAPQVAQLAAHMPSLIKGVKPGTRHGSPTQA